MKSEFSVGQTKTIGDLIKDRKEVYWVWSDNLVPNIAVYMKDRHLRAIGVKDRQYQLVGIVSQGDFVNKLLAKLYEDPSSFDAADIMSTEIISVKEIFTVTECLKIMNEKDINHLAVFGEEGRYRGLISRKDVDRACLEQLEEYTKVLHDYISQA